MGKLTISMAIFNSYFDITRGYQGDMAMATLPGPRARLMPWSVGWGLRVATDLRGGVLKWGDPHGLMVSICFSSLMTWMGWRKT